MVAHAKTYGIDGMMRQRGGKYEKQDPHKNRNSLIWSSFGYFACFTVSIPNLQ